MNVKVFDGMIAAVYTANSALIAIGRLALTNNNKKNNSLVA